MRADTLSLHPSCCPPTPAVPFYLPLQRTGLDQQLIAASDPAYAGPVLPAQQFTLDLPWWFFGAQPAAAAPSTPISEEPAAPPAPGVPAAGPYTVSDPAPSLSCVLL
jgi:hypothetical protein